MYVILRNGQLYLFHQADDYEIGGDERLLLTSGGDVLATFPIDAVAGWWSAAKYVKRIDQDVPVDLTQPGH